MNKSFRSIDEQVEILHLRGISTTAETRTILLREGYYAVVNGYKLPLSMRRPRRLPETTAFFRARPSMTSTRSFALIAISARSSSVTS